MKLRLGLGNTLVFMATLTITPAPVLAADAPPSAYGSNATQGAAAQAGPENLVVARSIVTIAFPPDRRQAMMDKIMNTILAQMKAGMSLDTITDPGLRQIMLDYINGVPHMLRPATSAFIPKQMEAIAQAYTHMFSLSELHDIVAFAQTPSGQTFLQRSTDVLSDPTVAEVNSVYFKEAGAISRQGAEQLKMAYIKAHPEAAPKKQATQ